MYYGRLSGNSDHLGSSSYISTLNGQISQHVEYIAFGEVLFEEHSSSFKSPYLFNGKELDRETNLTNFGARYLDMKTSLWLTIDPLAEKFPNQSPYAFCNNNPVYFVDPNGMEAVPGDDIYVYKNQKTQVVHTGDSTPNRLFVQDASANKNTENRMAHNGSYFEQKMIPSSSYSEADYKAQGFMGSSQFDKDRNAYISGGGDYSDKNYVQRLGTSLGDDPVTIGDLSILLMPKSGKSEVGTPGETSVYRVYGGDAKPDGFSWTSKNPNGISNYRDAAGLPSGGASGSNNTGRFVIEGTVSNKNVINIRPALKLDGNKGGLPELIINPSNVRINRVSGANPKF